MPLRKAWRLLVCLAVCLGVHAQTYGVGAGSTPGVQAAFVAAYQRNNFSNLTGAAIENVTAWGSGGLIQRFLAASNSSLLYALVKPDATNAFNAVQVYPAIYAYYANTVTPAAAGFPSGDTAACPTLTNAAATAAIGNTCTWQPFTNNYALFAFTGAVGAFGQTFAIHGTIYSNWTSLGGVTGIGPAESPEKQIYSLYSTGAIEQLFDHGAIYNMNFGPSNGKVFVVQPPIYAVYAANGSENGSLGLPTGPVQLNSDGTRQQDFDRGAISYNTSTLVATLQPAVASVTVSLGPSALMYAGEALGATATALSSTGSTLLGRTIAWNSSNTAVVQIQGSGQTVSLHAIAAGAATVTATSEGQNSAALTVTVAACCQVGQGAPTAAIEQDFQSAVARNNLNIQLPATAAVTRAGNGYTQQLVSTLGVPYLVTVADGATAGYLVTGGDLTAYQQAGGPTGVLGYPMSDANTTGRQMFQGGALAGIPAQAVTGTILTKWEALGYETGTAGAPTSPATAFLTIRGTSGAMQSFQNAQILAASTGSLAGQGFYVKGLILARYASSGGPSGNLGAPTGDEHVSSGQQRQDFEGGYVYYNPGDSIAIEFDAPRTPAVSVSPATVRAGAAVHVVVAGFNNSATVRVSQTGQADFFVSVSNGTYAWDELIPVSAAAGTVTVKAVDANNSASTAQATYSVYTTGASAMTLSIAGGDQQTGAPAALLPLPLKVVLKDQNGNGIAGQTVAFAASPGALPTAASAVTDANGFASISLRMPASSGLSLATAQAGKSIVTFNELSQASSLANFPALSQNVSGTVGNGADTLAAKGALVTAAAAILQYHQSRGDLPQPNGLANVTLLNRFMASYCTPDAQGNSICDGFLTLGTSTEQTLNLWRVGAFVGGSLSVVIEPTTQNEIRDLVAQGVPALVALQLGTLGSHFVVATGVASDGTIQIMDPNPAFAQTTLNGYLSGFGGVGQYVQATLAGVVRLLPQAPASPGFLAVANAAVAVSSNAGACSLLTFPGIAAAAGVIPAAAPAPLAFAACDGSASAYELDVTASPGYNAIVTDLSPDGSRTFLSGAASNAYSIARASSTWQVAPLSTSIIAVVNAASFTNAIAPDGFISIFGAGLANATVQVNGASATVVAATPFQVNAQVPVTVAIGSATVQVNTPEGVAQQSIAISPNAPAIFSVAPSQAAITNVDNSLNTATNSAQRGSYLIIYATGLGALSTSGSATAPVIVNIGGVNINAAYAGASSSPGLNQINVLIPATLPPGLSLPLYLAQGGVSSNTVTVAIQ